METTDVVLQADEQDISDFPQCARRESTENVPAPPQRQGEILLADQQLVNHKMLRSPCWAPGVQNFVMLPGVFCTRTWNQDSNAPPAENGTPPPWMNPPGAARPTSKTARSAASRTSFGSNTTIRLRNLLSRLSWNESGKSFLRVTSRPSSFKVFRAIVSCPVRRTEEDSHGHRLYFRQNDQPQHGHYAV